MLNEAVLLGCGAVRLGGYCLKFWSNIVPWRCQDLHTRWQNITSQMTRIISSTVVSVSNHTSHLSQHVLVPRSIDNPSFSHATKDSHWCYLRMPYATQPPATLFKRKEKKNTVLLQVWSGPEGSRNLRFPNFMTTSQDGGKFVSLMQHPPLPPGNAPGTHFC